MKRPLGVSFISYFYIFGAIILLITSAKTEEIGIATRFGLSNVPEQLMRVLVALFSLVVIYGYMRLKKWGFWMMIGYSVVFGLISFTLALSHKQQPFIGNTVWSIIVLLYTCYVNKSFSKRNI
jgi:hypothetical protein